MEKQNKIKALQPATAALGGSDGLSGLTDAQTKASVRNGWTSELSSLWHHEKQTACLLITWQVWTERSSGGKSGGWKRISPPPQKKKKSITTQQQTKFRFESCLVFVFMMTWEGSAVSWLVPGEKSEPVADRLSHKSNTSVTVRTSMGMWVGLRGRRCWGLLSPFRQHVWHQRGFFFFSKISITVWIWEMGTLFFSRNIFLILLLCCFWKCTCHTATTCHYMHQRLNPLFYKPRILWISIAMGSYHRQTFSIE